MFLKMIPLRLLGFFKPSPSQCFYHTAAVSACVGIPLQTAGRGCSLSLLQSVSCSRTPISVGRRLSSKALLLQDDNTTRNKDVLRPTLSFDHKAEKLQFHSSEDSRNARQNSDELDSIGRTGIAKYKADWTLRELYMVTCDEIWDDQPEGAQVIVSYIDTAALIPAAQRQQMPSVLLVPSGIANDTGLQNLCDALVHNGFRLVIPNLMGSGTTRGMTSNDDDAFSNQLGERSTFLYDFIHQLDIDRYDIAIGYSLGCWPLTPVAAHFNLFRSVAFISPIPGHEPFKLVQPVWLTRRLLAMTFSWFWQPISWLWMAVIWRRQVKNWLDVDKISLSHMQLILSILLGINWANIPNIAMTMESRKVPLLYIYSEQDREIDCKSSAEYAEMFGVTSHFTDTYDEHGKLVLCNDQGAVTAEHYVRGLRTSCPTQSLMETGATNVLVEQLLKLYEHRLCNNS